MQEAAPQRLATSTSKPLSHTTRTLGKSSTAFSSHRARRSGGNLTEIFDTIAETIRARLRIRQHVRTLTAQGRLQGLIIGAMPFLLGIGMAIFKPSLMMPFVCSLVGAGTIAAVVLLVALGGWMIRRIVTIDV